LLDEAEAVALPLWLQGGWAIDARLGRVTRVHEDVDLAVPGDRLKEFRAVLNGLGAGVPEAVKYGFLVRIGDVLFDCEPCMPCGTAYELDGVPPGACPDRVEGVLQGRPVRCVSWAAIAWDYFHYLDEVHFDRWPAKDRESYALLRRTIGDPEVESLLARYRSIHPRD